MPFDTLSPELVAALAARGITEPTDPQRDAIPRIQAGHNVLTVAPTGIGKTESAMLPIMDRIHLNGGNGFRCIYITPLRALNRDMLRRLTDLGDELGVTVGVRHGDTEQSERNRQSRNPPQILITTPETLQILFIGKNLREALKNVRWVVIDEIHELAGSERGAQLAVALERLAYLAGNFQRIGLSATVGNIEAVRDFLVGAGRTADICKHDSFREFDIDVRCPVADDGDAELRDKLQSDPDMLAVMKDARGLIESVKSTLFFVNTRETAEWIGSRYRMWDEDFPIEVHHGSLSKEVRATTEDRFRDQTLKALICTSSLELGIDIGSADLVIQYNSPRRVARMTQRAGRAGHRIGGRIRAVILATAPDEILEAMVVARRCEAKIMEDNSGRPQPLDVLANQLVGLAMQGDYNADEAYNLVRRSHPFKDLDKELFDKTLEQLMSIWILSFKDGKVHRGRKGMEYFYQNISMIPDEKTYKVRDIGSRAIIGTLDEGFVATLEGETVMFIAKGRTWRVVEMREDELLVEEVKSVGDVPSWQGSDIPVPFDIAMEVGTLRRVRNFSKYPADNAAIHAVDAYLAHQSERYVVPDDRTVTIETGPSLAIINCCFGTCVNQTLSKIVSALIVARTGESVGITIDAYRIILQLSHGVDSEVVKEVLLSIRPGTAEAFARMTILKSTFLKWRFVNVAKKFGIVEKNADRRFLNFNKLFDMHRDTPAFLDAVNKVLWEDLDIPNTDRALEMIHSGRIRIVEQPLSPIGLEGITRSKELMQPARADHAILAAMKTRLGKEMLFASCLNCKAQHRIRVSDVPRNLVCDRCGGRMLALLKEYERDDIAQYGKDRKIDARLRKNASLVNAYGSTAALVLAGRGVGPEVAGRILAKMHVTEDDLLRDIMSSEVTYARTKQFWD